MSVTTAGPDAPTPARSLFAGFCRLALEAFYRLTHLGGEVPRQGPVLLVGNHPNGLIDPILLARVARRPVRPLAKAPLFRMPVIGWLVQLTGALPVYRSRDGEATSQNEGTFTAVEEALLRHECVSVFPEGESHDEERVLPLKTGAARMALGAAARAGFRSGIVVVPVGILSWEKQHFRGEIATLVGPSIAVDEWAEQYALDPRDAVRSLTYRIEEALKKAALDLERREDKPLLLAVDALWTQSEPARMKRLKVLADGVARLHRERPEVLGSVRERVVQWLARLQELGLRPDDVQAQPSPARIARFAARNFAALLLGTPAAVIGALVYAVPFVGARLTAERMKPEPDLVATVKLLSSLVYFPLWHALVVTYVAMRAGTQSAVLAATLLPLCGAYTRHFVRRREAALRDVGVFFKLASQGALSAELLAEKEALSADIARLADVVESLDRPPEVDPDAETVSPSHMREGATKNESLRRLGAKPT